MVPANFAKRALSPLCFYQKRPAMPISFFHSLDNPNLPKGRRRREIITGGRARMLADYPRRRKAPGKPTIIYMDTTVQTEDVIQQKTRELCEVIVRQPQFQAIRRQMESFLADAKAQQQYESLGEKSHQLRQKQQQGLQLSPAEIDSFDTERDAFFNNPIGKGFVDAQEAMHHIQDEVNQLVTKTFELGRVPTAEELESQGSCGHGCGCHH
jgi:cell fate (sporulation/competence/biofilm development) regulator YlbF (YheA/YmcA/DUF963 family)